MCILLQCCIKPEFWGYFMVCWLQGQQSLTKLLSWYLSTNSAMYSVWFQLLGSNTLKGWMINKNMKDSMKDEMALNGPVCYSCKWWLLDNEWKTLLKSVSEFQEEIKCTTSAALRTKWSNLPGGLLALWLEHPTGIMEVVVAIPTWNSENSCSGFFTCCQATIACVKDSVQQNMVENYVNNIILE